MTPNEWVKKLCKIEGKKSQVARSNVLEIRKALIDELVAWTIMDKPSEGSLLQHCMDNAQKKYSAMTTKQQEAFIKRFNKRFE